MSTHSNQDVACQTCGGQLVLGNLFCDTCRQMWGAPEGVKSADYGTRAAAYILDMVITWGLSIVVIVLGIVFALSFNNFWIAIIPLIVIWLAYLVWWVMLLRRSQTPGKLIMKLWVIRDGGQPAGWGLMFVREFFIKGLLFGILGGVTLYIAILLDLLWPLWDRNKQTLHDKIIGTHVVQGPRQERSPIGPTEAGRFGERTLEHPRGTQS